MQTLHAARERSARVNPDQDDFNALPEKKAAREWAMMTSSQRFILQAEVEYWHEMLHLNRNRMSEQKESEMRYFLKCALRELNAMDEKTPLAAA